MIPVWSWILLKLPCLDFKFKMQIQNISQHAFENMPYWEKLFRFKVTYFWFDNKYFCATKISVKQNIFSCILGFELPARQKNFQAKVTNFLLADKYFVQRKFYLTKLSPLNYSCPELFCIHSINVSQVRHLRNRCM